MASMRNWLHEKTEDEKKRVVVVHCKAGKGRSGTVACSYLISEEGWNVEDALKRFTEKRMRAGFGEGVSIPSQLRWVGYVDQWTKTGKAYVERQVEILEVHTWGLRDGVKVGIDGYVEEGKVMKTFHTFKKAERIVVDGAKPADPSTLASLSGFATSTYAPHSADTADPHSKHHLIRPDNLPENGAAPEQSGEEAGAEIGGRAVIFKPDMRIVLPSSDICIDLERRNRAPYGFTMVTSVAHVWFNVFFEGLQAEPTTAMDGPPESASEGVFEIDWEKMDGIKGSVRKGIRAVDRIAVVWRALDLDGKGGGKVIREPGFGEPTPEARPADWKQGGTTGGDGNEGKELGLRAERPGSEEHSKANSVKSLRRDGAEDAEKVVDDDYEGSMRGVMSSVDGAGDEPAVKKAADGVKHLSTEDLPDGVPVAEMATKEESRIGSVGRHGTGS
jgi:protein-tyrosine phosphatase